MKINEVCKRTGLSERAIRFYVEEYFKSPRTMQTGAREYYEAMQITGEAYDTFEIRVEIPYVR